ncbi:ammonia monooxygenase [Pseudomonas sp. S25]|uniref:Ammonia monooxygenase n=1 Tax=Pseudomonas maioricensis TaxID=1766623 RepID=A0ABS9ZRJ1_9PSED|nr:AbrB family transcriptional regulator [Pseudomonas sp. S25]MCI8212821.1 ammonia monooxygenase [Pseudomonas sp. S25]
MKILSFWLACVGGGVTLEYLGIPHGLLLGSILVSAIIVSKWGFSPPLKFGLGYVQIVLGVATGLMFDAWDSRVVGALLPSIAFMVLCHMAQIAVAGFWLSSVSKWSIKDSLLAVYPGALAAVFDLMESERASSKVMVVHLIRLLGITVLVSIFMPVDAQIVATSSELTGPGMFLVVSSLIALSLLSGRLLFRFGVPAPFMLTAIICTGIYVKMGYLGGFQVPRSGVLLATLVLGVLIGTKFRDVTWVELLRHGRSGLVSVILMLSIAGGFALLAGRVLDEDPFTLWLAYMPGAIETIAIVAFSSGLNVVFILSHHLVRMVLLHFAPALIVRLRR